MIIGTIFLRLFPKHSRSIAMTLKERPWASLGIGFIALISVPVIFVILLITVVGIPLAFILLALYFIALYLVRIFVALWAGMTVFDRLGKDPTRIYKAFIAGLVIYFLITLIPIAGGLVSILVQTIGLGAAILAEKRAYTAARTASRV